MKALLCMILILQALLSSCQTGFIQTGYINENGVWKYISLDEGAGRRVKSLNADNDTFTVLKNERYAKDKNNVFFDGHRIDTAMSDSFKVINDFGYAKDSNYVFVGNDKIIGANPQTFTFIDFPYSKDDKDIYCGTIPMFVKNIDEFKVIQRGRMTHSTTTEYFIRQNPNYSFINQEMYPGVFYSDGQGETSNQKFEGYRLVERK
jgi:DKNYY family